MSKPREVDDLVRVAFEVADAGHKPVLSRFRSPDLTVCDKAPSNGFDPVTLADTEAELAMRAVIERLRPEDAILGEEHGFNAGESGFTWVLDPIDGTRAFVAGATSWGVLVAVGDSSGPIIGVVDQPYVGERFFGVRHGSTAKAHWMRGEERQDLRTKACASLDDAILLTTFPEIGNTLERASFKRVAARARLTRYGLDCYGYMLVALGCADLVIEAGLQPYDVQALIPVIEGAGGVITNWLGDRCDAGGRVIAAGDKRIHEAAVRLLNEA